MFQVINIRWPRVGEPVPSNSRVYPAAVDLLLGLVIPFDTVEVARHTVTAFNHEGLSYNSFSFAPIDQCYFADTGKPLLDRTAPIDRLDKSIVNVFGLDYVVPGAVAQQVAELKKALAAACEKLAEQAKTTAQREAETDARWKKGFEDFARGVPFDEDPTIKAANKICGLS